MSRDRIDEVRRLLVDAFMADDIGVYAKCVHDLEELIGVPHGDRNHHDTSGFSQNKGPPDKARERSIKSRKATAKARRFIWGKNELDAELEDGVLTYSIKYGDEE